GRAINPMLVEGQIEGGAMMCLGLGVLEQAYPEYPSPEHQGDQFGAYLVPAMEDLPELDNVILENPSVDGPFGAKAIGEMANNAQPAAIATAIHDAVGVWVTEYPASPERVLAALRERREPRRDGKRVIFDEELSVGAVSGKKERDVPPHAGARSRSTRNDVDGSIGLVGDGTRRLTQRQSV